MNSLSDNQVLLYEEPVQEKIRKFIKIEFLLSKIYHFKGKENKKLEEYNSFNTKRLSKKELTDLLASIGYK